MELERQVAAILLTLFLIDCITWTQAGLLDAFGSIVGGLVNPDEKTNDDDDTGFSRNPGRGFEHARGWLNPTNQYDSRQEKAPNYKNPSHNDFDSRYLNTHRNQQFPRPSNGASDPSSTDGRNPKYFPNSNNIKPAKFKNDERVTTTSTEKPELKVLKPLTKKKFYFQVQPVVPEGERTDISETIYYVD